VFVINRNVAAIAAVVATGGLLTALSMVSASNGSGGDWLRRIAPQITAERLVTPNNQSLSAVSLRMFAPHTFEAIRLSASRSTTVTVRPLVDKPFLARVLTWTVGIAVGLLTGFVLVATRHATNRLAHVSRFALVLTVLLVLLPVVWDHYYVLLLLPVAVLYRRYDLPVVRLALLGSAVSILAHRYWRLTLYAGSPLLLMWGLIGVFGLWAGLLSVLRHEAGRPAIIEVS
jgi:hypothetical protein